MEGGVATCGTISSLLMYSSIYIILPSSHMATHFGGGLWPSAVLLSSCV